MRERERERERERVTLAIGIRFASIPIAFWRTDGVVFFTCYIVGSNQREYTLAAKIT